MIRTILVMLALMFALPVAAQGEPEAKAAVEAAMADSAAGWDAGNLDRFLAIYSDDPATSFPGSNGIVRGTGPIRERYISGYPQVFGPAAGTDKPKLSFSMEDFRMLGPDHALLIARWKLAAPGKEDQTGMTSLVFRKEAGGWKIIADHS
jgi:uncharacterized protein (TIGR02246 family)